MSTGLATPIEYLNKWKNGTEAFRKSGMPTEWEIARIQECVDALFTFAKFKVGDTVEMAKTYEVNVTESWGWMSIRHLLKEGSKATITEVDYYDGDFRYQIRFLENTWIDDKNVIQESTYKPPHITLREKWLREAKKLPKRPWNKK